MLLLAVKTGETGLKRVGESGVQAVVRCRGLGRILLWQRQLVNVAVLFESCLQVCKPAHTVML